MSADIGAVVVTYRSAETVALCLSRLLAADGVAAVRVVDNGSDDGTLEIVARIASADPRLRFVANPGNPGFAVACNQGAADLDTAWLAFVNPDCLVGPDTLARLRDHASRLDPALLGADLVDEDGVRDGAARRRDPDFLAMLAGVIGGRGGTDLSLAMSDEPVQRVPAVSGALMLLSPALFARIGGFDEGYRLHAEDLDLCRRARDAGATVAVANAVRVVHVRGVSSRSRPVFVEWHKHRGLWRYFTKFEASRRGPAVRAAVFVAIAARFVLAVPRAWWRGRG